VAEFSETLRDVPAHAWAIVAGVLLLQRVLRRASLWIYALFVLPGTAAHEVSHWLVAALTGARPQWPRLWPARDGNRWRLGSVAFHPAWWRTAPIAMAPLLLLPLAAIWIVHFMAAAGGTALVLHGWIAGTLLGAALPSPADLKLAAPALAVACIGIAGWLLVAR
jgi:hypothetical protein